jgi:hypothetical protein
MELGRLPISFAENSGAFKTWEANLSTNNTCALARKPDLAIACLAGKAATIDLLCLSYPLFNSASSRASSEDSPNFDYKSAFNETL